MSEISKPINVALIGCGSQARSHAARMLQQNETTSIIVVSDPSDAAYQAMRHIFTSKQLTPPPNVPDLTQLLDEYGKTLDAAFIITPHAYHFQQAKDCLEADLDVLLEKPMVINASEAQDLISARNATGRLLVVAFNGSLSPQIRTAAKILRGGELGDIMTINAVVWEDWSRRYINHWKQDSAISGGGFMFDTGAHMLNTVADLAGEDFTEVAAWLDNRDRAVDILGVVMGRLQSGALVTMTACGNTPSRALSKVHVFCSNGIIETGVWGGNLAIQRSLEDDVPQPVTVPASQGAWEQFLAVRNGVMENPSPPEIGLRMAKLWDAIQQSAAQNGAVIKL